MCSLGVAVFDPVSSNLEKKLQVKLYRWPKESNNTLLLPWKLVMGGEGGGQQFGFGVSLLDEILLSFLSYGRGNLFTAFLLILYIKYRDNFASAF